MAATIDSRAFERAPLDVEVTVESENNFYSGIANDISEGGVFIATIMPPVVGTEISFALRLYDENSPTWHVTGVVRWIRSFEAACDGCPPGCGIQWRNIPAAALREIANFVAQRDTILFEAA
jgi:uncharacterized protein (TIGR02266 family)